MAHRDDMNEKSTPEVDLADQHGELASAIRHHSRDNSRDYSNDLAQFNAQFQNQYNSNAGAHNVGMHLDNGSEIMHRASSSTDLMEAGSNGAYQRVNTGNISPGLPNSANNKRPVTPTTLGLTGWAQGNGGSPSSSPGGNMINNMSGTTINGANVPGNRNSRSTTPRPLLDQQMTQDYMRSPPWAPSPGPSVRISSLYDGPSDFPSSSTSLRSSRVGNQSHLSLAAFLPKGSGDEGEAYEMPQEGGEKSLPPGAIVKLHDRDDVDINSNLFRFATKLTPFLTITAIAAYILYVSFRIYCVIASERAGGKVYAPAWVFIAIELAVWIPSVTHNVWTMMALKNRRRPKLRLTGDEVPTVDVFITCCGEDDDLVMDTLRGACDQDYPRDMFRVVLLDDGKSEGLERGCAQLNEVYGNVYYVARPKYPGVPHHFKSGNLNYGLEAVTRFPGGAGEYCGALDADMIPEKQWLRAILPHLIINSKMALACPPQLFYNTPRSDPLAQNLDFFVHVIEPIKDSLGVAWCTGSGYVLRRTAIDDVGHFPLGSLAEDVATSTLMLGKGWQTAYVHEPLQFGTVPDDYASHIKQRTRWAIGTVDTSMKLNFCLWGDEVRHMTFPQRFSGFLYSFLSLYSILFSLSLFAIPIILVMGHSLIAYTTENQLRWLVRLCFASLMTNRINEIFMFMPAGYHTGQRGSRYQLWMSPYISLCLIRSFILPKWLGGQTQAFKPTGSLSSALNERDPKTRRNVFIRLWTILVNYNAMYHLAFVYLTLIGVSLSTYRCVSINAGNTHDILLCLLTHAFWPPMTFLFLCTSLWTPISYAIYPPNMPERERLLVRDPDTLVAHPTQQSKKIAFGGQAAFFEFEYTLTTVYTCLCFGATFFF